MAGRADGRIRGGVPRLAARSHPRHHPRQPEMLRAARRRAASSPTNSSSSRTSSPRRRRGDRGGQWPRRARAPLRRAPFLADRSRSLAGCQGQEPRSRSTSGWRSSTLGRLSREARHAGRADRAHRGAGARACAEGSAPIPSLPRARRISPRPTSSPKWSANSLNCRG